MEGGRRVEGLGLGFGGRGGWEVGIRRGLIWDARGLGARSVRSVRRVWQDVGRRVRRVRRVWQGGVKREGVRREGVLDMG